MKRLLILLLTLTTCVFATYNDSDWCGIMSHACDRCFRECHADQHHLRHRQLPALPPHH